MSAPVILEYRPLLRVSVSGQQVKILGFDTGSSLVPSSATCDENAEAIDLAEGLLVDLSTILAGKGFAWTNRQLMADKAKPQMWTHEFRIPLASIPDTEPRPAQEWLRETLDAAGLKDKYAEATAFLTRSTSDRWVVTIEGTEAVLRFCSVLFNLHGVSAHESERLEATLAEGLVPVCPNCGASGRWSADVDVTNRAKVNLSGSVLVDRAEPEGSFISKAGAFNCDACGYVVDDNTELYKRLWPLAQELVASPEPRDERRWRVIYSYTEV